MSQGSNSYAGAPSIDLFSSPYTSDATDNSTFTSETGEDASLAAGSCSDEVATAGLKSAWWKIDSTPVNWLARLSTEATVDNGNGVDTLLHVYTGTAAPPDFSGLVLAPCSGCSANGTGANEACDDQSGAVTNTSVIADLPLLAGTTYYVRVSTWETAGPVMEYVLEVQADQTSIAVSATAFVSVFAAASLDAEVSAQAAVGAIASGKPGISVSVGGSASVSSLSVGAVTSISSGPSGKALAGVRENGGLSSILVSTSGVVEVGFFVSALATSLQKTAFASVGFTASGLFSSSQARSGKSFFGVSISGGVVACPTNDSFACAVLVDTSVGGAYTSASVNNSTFTTEPGETFSSCGGGESRTAWWVYTPMVSGTVSLDTFLSTLVPPATSQATVLSVYTGTAVGALTQVGCHATFLSLPVTAYTSYYIKVAAFGYVAPGADSIAYVLHAVGPSSSLAFPPAADLLELWLPLSEEVVPSGYFNWGSLPRRESSDVQFRVHNKSTLYRADNVTISASAFGSQPAAPADIDKQHLLSAELPAFRFTAAIDSLTPNLWPRLDLEPGATSDVVTLRRNIASDCTVGGPYQFKVRADAESWY